MTADGRAPGHQRPTRAASVSPLAVTVGIVGDRFVGKTSVCVALANGLFVDDPSMHENSDDWTLHTVWAPSPCGRKRLRMHMWDMTRPDALLRGAPSCDLWIAAYSVTSLTSFENAAEKWLPLLRQHDPSTPLVMLATKIEQRAHLTVRQSVRSLQLSVSEVAGRTMALEKGAVDYLEFCAWAIDAAGDDLFVGHKELFQAVREHVQCPPDEPMPRGKRCLIM